MNIDNIADGIIKHEVTKFVQASRNVIGRNDDSMSIALRALMAIEQNPADAQQQASRALDAILGLQ